MSIIKCFECGKEVSSHANLCPHCGYDIAAHILNIMPPLDLDLHIGPVTKNSTLLTEILGGSKTVRLACHTHGLSLSNIECDRVDLIPFNHVISLSVKYFTYFYRGIFLTPYSASYLYLEYWNWRDKKRKKIELVLVDRRSIFVKEEAVYKNFVKNYNKALLESKSKPAEKISPEESLKDEIKKIEKSEHKATFAGCAFMIFFALLFFFPSFSGLEPDSAIARVWVILFGICVFIIFIAFLRIINCILYKYLEI